MHCCRETKANVAEKLRRKDVVRGFGTSVGGLKRAGDDGGEGGRTGGKGRGNE